MTIDVTQEEKELLLLLREAKALCYADVVIKYHDGKLATSELTKKFKHN